MAEKAEVNCRVAHRASPESPSLGDQTLFFDIRNTEGDKFINSIIFSDSRKLVTPLECKAFDQWRVQSDMNFGFIPLTDPILPIATTTSDIPCVDPIKLHEEVKNITCQII